MLHMDGKHLISSSLTLRVHAEQGKPEHRLLSMLQGRVAGGKLVLTFTALPLPDRAAQFEMRARRQRTQR